jgi:paraquat-inducible protein A
MPPAFATSMWLMRVLRPWRMVEVFLLGVVVAIVKLSALSTATPEWGLFGIVVMTFAFASLASFDLATLWRRAEELAA